MRAGIKQKVSAAAERFDQDEVTIYRWRSEVQYRESVRKLQDFRAEHPDVFTGVEDVPPSHFDWTEAHLEVMLDGFVEFRRKYFLTPQRKPYETPDFQRRWAKSMLALAGDGWPFSDHGSGASRQVEAV